MYKFIKQVSSIGQMERLKLFKQTNRHTDRHTDNFLSVQPPELKWINWDYISLLHGFCIMCQFFKKNLANGELRH